MNSNNTRRAVLCGVVGLSAAIAIPKLLTPASAQTTLRATPNQTEGPYYPLSLPGDSDFDLLQNGSRAYSKGQPVWVEGVVTDIYAVPVSGAVVEIWQCDEDGHYHHPADGNNADPNFQGFGRTTAGKDGRYRFRAIRPAPYTGRTPHIHVKVKLGNRELLTTQLYVAGDIGNQRDTLWRRLNEQDQSALTRAFVPSNEGLKVDFPIIVRT